MKNLITLVFFCIISLTCTQGQAQSPAWLDEMPAIMNKHNVIGANIIIYRDFEEDLYWENGLKDKEAVKPIARNTVFPAGSLSTVPMRLCLVQLAQQGKIDLDAPINDYLKSWKIPNSIPTIFKAVTVRDVMMHKPNWKAPYKPYGYQPNDKLPSLVETLEGKANIKKVKVRRFKNWLKNNMYVNDLILQLLLEDMYGMSLDDIVQKQVFEPLGMTNSSYNNTPNAKTEAQLATGYFKADKQPLDGRYPRFVAQASAGLYTTINDYAKLMSYFMQAYNGKNDSIINQAWAKQAIDPADGLRGLIMYKGSSWYWGAAPTGYRISFNGDFGTGWMVLSFANSYENWEFSRDMTSKAIPYAIYGETK